MAYYQDGKIIEYPPQTSDNKWYKVDCGCCGGLQWGGDEPRECYTCKGWGFYYWHKPSKTFAQYPGGPFSGKGELDVTNAIFVPMEK